MKKIAFLLALLLAFSVFATACNNEGGNTSEISEQASGESSVSEDQNVIRTGIAVSENPFATVVSTGASYTSNVKPEEKYPDTYGTELTDGIRVVGSTDNYGEEALSGYTQSAGRVRVIVDLGYVCDKLYSFKVGYLSTTNAGINAPGSIAVHVSLDGKKWDNLGLLKKPQFEEGVMQEAELRLDEYVRARYVRFYISAASAWMFIDEIAAVADVDGSNANVEYLEAVNSAYQQLGALAKPQGAKEIDYSLSKVLISKDKTYKSEGTQNENFKDSGKMLTDGGISGYYEGKTWVGFNGGQEVKVTVDLGSNVDDIAAIEASFYTNTAVKLYLPVALKIAAITDDGTRTELSVLYANTTIVNGNYIFSLPLSKAINARYIEFTMVSTDSNMYLVEELGVYAYRAVSTSELYPTVILEDDATEWGSEASKDYVNLIANKTQQIIAAGDPGKDSYENNTSVSSTLMTDGKKSGSTDIHNGNFFKFSNGGGRVIIYDLEHISAVDKFTASFTQNLDWAVTAPSTIQVCISIDGSNWYEVGIMEKEGTASNALYSYSLKLSGKVKARYVLFNFAVAAWAGCDEIEVFGTKSVSGASEPTKYENISLLENKRKEPSEELLGGTKDLCLLYQKTDRAYTAEDLIPYLAYVDENGVQKDTMFDSFLFLFLGDFPVGGGQAHKNGTKAGWEWALEDAFKDGQNLKAMEEAAGQVKQNLGLAEDFKYKVSLTLYYPSLGVTNFGDVDGDGTSENLDNLKDRFKVMEWYIKKIRTTFDEQNFQNIELVGYYWFHEAIEAEDHESVELLNKIADLVHKQNCEFFWIPYFTANGYDAWAQYGFDIAVMQPNYVFELGTPYSNVSNCANLTKLYGMGIEMEICSDALTNINYFKKYMQYVAGGVEYGYMTDCVVMYYQGVTDFRDACNSKNLMGRMVYDATYHFIKEDLKYKPDAIEKISLTVSKDTPCNGKIDFTGNKLRMLAIDEMPEHGTVTLCEDGSFTFYPEKGFTGEVTFTYTYSEYLGWSDPCEVTITVQ